MPVRVARQHRAIARASRARRRMVAGDALPMAVHDEQAMPPRPARRLAVREGQAEPITFLESRPETDSSLHDAADSRPTGRPAEHHEVQDADRSGGSREEEERAYDFLVEIRERRLKTSACG